MQTIEPQQPDSSISDHPQRQFFIMKVTGLLLTGFLLAILAYHSYRHNSVLTQQVRYEIPDLGPVSARPLGPDLSPFTGVSGLKPKAIHLNFWASWCEPCLAELPLLEKTAQEHGSQLQVILINTDQSPSSIVEAKSLQKRLAPSLLAIYDAPNQSTARQLTEKMNVEALPYHVLLDQRGSVAATFYIRLDQHIERYTSLLGQLLTEQ